MGLSNIIKTETWIKLIGKNPNTFSLLSLLILGLPFVFVTLKILTFLDALTYVLASDYFSYKFEHNVLSDHFISASLNILTGSGFIYAAFKMYKTRDKEMMLFITSAFLSIFSLFGFYAMIVTPIFLSLSIYLWTKVANIIQVSIKLIENLFLAFEQKIHIKFLDRVKANLAHRGFNAFVSESLDQHRNQTNIILTCSEEYYNKIHNILLKFCTNDETAKMFINFILENKLYLENGVFYKEENGLFDKSKKLNVKEVFSLFQEYVDDSRSINTSTKEFLNPDHLA